MQNSRKTRKLYQTVVRLAKQGREVFVNHFLEFLKSSMADSRCYMAS